MLVSLLAFASASCAPTPQLAIAPEVLSGSWREPVDGVTSLSEAWRAFGSAELDELITRARTANADIAIARARVIQARGQLGVARAATLPALFASADLGALSGSDRRSLNLGRQSVGLDIAYDVDLFGSASAGNRIARARLAASAFERDAVALAIESEVARAYIQHATFSARIALLDRALVNARELDRIIGVRVREGVATSVDSGLQTIEVRRIESEISRIVEAQVRTRNALAVLVGEEAPRFNVADASLFALKAPMFSPIQPGELLAKRPDMRAAEARIAAASGDVERARAAFLPSLRISAGSLFDAGSGGALGLAYSAGSSLLAPIFSGGRLKGRLTTATGAQLETVESYRKTLLAALAETEDALTGIAAARRRETLLTETVTLAQKTARLARSQYVEGAADLQTVLNAERGALDVDDALAVATQDRLGAAIDLYRALGGSPIQEEQRP